VSDPKRNDAGEGDRQPTPEAVRGQPGRLLATAEFVASGRLEKFLRLVGVHLPGREAESRPPRTSPYRCNIYLGLCAVLACAAQDAQDRRRSRTASLTGSAPRRRCRTM
jgi:hypothetical protein